MTSSQVRTRQASTNTPATAGKPVLQNRNFLQPTGFRFQVSRAPKVTFFGNAVNIPGMTLRTARQTTPGLKDIDLPGEIIDFEDLTLRFLVDEDLQNYMEIQDWIRGLGFPENYKEIYDLQADGFRSVIAEKQGLNIFSDGSLTVLDSMQNDNFKVVFKDLFPVSLSTIEFDATIADMEYFTAEVTFKYLIYDFGEIGFA
tara:strand:+ start:185 stop:784 length:600 start_codon:yes stop_codon:yes gene_type:complete